MIIAIVPRSVNHLSASIFFQPINSLKHFRLLEKSTQFNCFLLLPSSNQSSWSVNFQIQFINLSGSQQKRVRGSYLNFCCRVRTFNSFSGNFSINSISSQHFTSEAKLFFSLLSPARNIFTSTSLQLWWKLKLFFPFHQTEFIDVMLRKTFAFSPAGSAFSVS